MAQPDPQNKLSWSTAGSVEKNLPYLLDAHRPVFEHEGVQTVLEVASGFGDHILAYASQFPHIHFRPTECNEFLVEQLRQRVSDRGLQNVLEPLKLDVLNAEDWRALMHQASVPFQVVSIINLCNVSPWKVTEAVFTHIRDPDHPILHHESGTLAMYCCLKRKGQFQSEADAEFDAVLRARSADFGVRNLEDIVALADAQGLALRSQEALGGGTNIFLTFR